MQHACSSCGHMQPKEQFSTTQFAKGAQLRRCKECVGGPAASAASNKSGSSNSSSKSKRPKQGGSRQGMVRVRDVQKHYGHLCEIPLQAYAEAGVAFSRNDFVSEEDVEAASNAWDARSIAHDIDTQWGAMPWGGAYSDSNHYFGPGDYDFY